MNFSSFRVQRGANRVQTCLKTQDSSQVRRAGEPVRAESAAVTDGATRTQTRTLPSGEGDLLIPLRLNKLKRGVSWWTCASLPVEGVLAPQDTPRAFPRWKKKTRCEKIRSRTSKCRHQKAQRQEPLFLPPQKRDYQTLKILLIRPSLWCASFFPVSVHYGL